MKKVININFQGRVIPIEEAAYEQLKQYIESLRSYFAKEEGRDEIINDIEGRIAELFSERLKKGTTCITEAEVNEVIAGMGRPEDFEAAEAETTASSGSAKADTGSQQQKHTNYQFQYGNPPGSRGRFYRNADDKVIAGVASGLANYLGIDPVIMRILFVILGGVSFWAYILLWVVVPSQSVSSKITKRLYRSADDKVIGGVCGGLASYFNIDTWIPRLIFALPLIIAIASGPFHLFWNEWDWWVGPRIITGSLSSTLFVTYIILWIAVPVAVTAAEKLEMKGERIDFNSISKTVKEDLEQFKTKAEKWGQEVKQSAQQFGEQAKDLGQTTGQTAKTFAYEAAPMARRTGNGVGHVIGVLFKAFFLFIAGIIALSLFGVLIGLIFGGFSVFSFKDFFLEGPWQPLLAWGVLLFFLAVPLIALITWLIRRIMGVRSDRHYLGYIFGTLWIVGLICVITLVGSAARNFKTRTAVEEPISLVQPANGKLYVDVVNSRVHYSGSDKFGIVWDDDFPIYGINDDSLMLNTVRVDVVKSKDENFHITRVRLSRGNNPERARDLAQKVNFEAVMKDSVLLLPQGFAISREEKFRNQQVLIVVEVPVGKKIQLSKQVSEFDYFTINFNNRRGWNVEWNNHWDDTYSWEPDQELVMTTDDGLVRTSRLDPEELKRGRFKELKEKEETDQQRDQTDSPKKQNSKEPEFRYRQKTDTVPAVNDTLKKTQPVAGVNEELDEEAVSSRKGNALQHSLYVLGRVFQ